MIHKPYVDASNYFERLRSDIDYDVTIEKFPDRNYVAIRYKGMYMSCHAHLNIVDWYSHDDSSGRQHWILEEDSEYPSDLFLRCVFRRGDFTQYLGAPNVDNMVYLYTSRNRFTRYTMKLRADGKHVLSFTGSKFCTREITLVIARFQEDLEWVRAYNDIAIVYNKGQHISTLASLRILQIPNIGREGHSYLYHILNNYNKLSDRTIFAQGDPFEHNETFLFGLDNYDKHLDVQPMGLVYRRCANIPPREVEEMLTQSTNYGFRFLTMNIDGNMRTPLFKDDGINILNRRFRLLHSDESKSLAQTFLDLCQFPIPASSDLNSLIFTYSALFSVCKKKIMNLSILNYMNLMHGLTKVDPQGGEYGYVLERLWLFIFSA